MAATAEAGMPSGAYVRVLASALDRRYASLRLTSPEAVAALSRSIARHGVLPEL